MTTTRSAPPKTTQADLDAAIMSKLAYGDIERIQKLAPDAKDRMTIREALGPQMGQRAGESTLTEQQARYMDQRFEVVSVRDFGDDIHAIALRDRETGHVTVAIPGTDLKTWGDARRAVGIVAGADLDATADVRDFVAEMHKQYGPVTVTGHSAGGYMAGKIAEDLGPRIVKRTRVGSRARISARTRWPGGSRRGGKRGPKTRTKKGKKVLKRL